MTEILHTDTDGDQLSLVVDARKQASVEIVPADSPDAALMDAALMSVILDGEQTTEAAEWLTMALRESDPGTRRSAEWTDRYGDTLRLYAMGFSIVAEIHPKVDGRLENLSDVTEWVVALPHEVAEQVANAMMHG